MFSSFRMNSPGREVGTCWEQGRRERTGTRREGRDMRGGIDNVPMRYTSRGGSRGYGKGRCVYRAKDFWEIVRQFGGNNQGPSYR